MTTEAKKGHLKHFSINLPARTREQLSETQKRFQARKRLEREAKPIVLDWARK